MVKLFPRVHVVVRVRPKTFPSFHVVAGKRYKPRAGCAMGRCVILVVALFFVLAGAEWFATVTVVLVRPTPTKQGPDGNETKTSGMKVCVMVSSHRLNFFHCVVAPVHTLTQIRTREGLEPAVPLGPASLSLV